MRSPTHHYVTPVRAAAAVFFRSMLLAVLFTMAACTASTPMLTRVSSSVLQWPARPMRAEVEWVKSVALPEDAGIGKSFWEKALEFVTGADKKGIVKPYGVLYDDSGRLFIADPGAGVVHVMDTRAGLYSVIASTAGSPLRSPIGLAEDRDNSLFITDSVTDTVYRYDLMHHVLTPLLRAVNRPTGIAYNKFNRMLYISETGANDVIAVDLHGAQKIRFSNVNADRSLFNHPTDIAVDLKGQVYVTDPLNYKVRIFTPEGIPVTQFGEMGDARKELYKPKGIAVDGEGRIFLCDAMLDMVKVFNDSGRLLFSFGATGTGSGDFWMPSGIYIHQKFIFVADTYNRRVQIFKILPRGMEPDDDADSGNLQISERVE